MEEYHQCESFLNAKGRLGRFCVSKESCPYDKINPDKSYQTDMGNLGKSCKIEGKIPIIIINKYSELEKVTLNS